MFLILQFIAIVAWYVVPQMATVPWYIVMLPLLFWGLVALTSMFGFVALASSIQVKS